uniref:Uncharacterized protein n=1 Tax=Craspedostauros australis TaxID=1486917 RepID=A0A7R9ZMZ4_9STRA
MAANNYYNGNGNYNGNRVRRNRHLDQNNNGNDDAAAGNDYNYNSYNNNYDQNAIQMAQAAYGYYDENGGWVEGDQDAFEELQEEYAYMGPGVIGADGQWYPADSDDECVQAYFEDYGCDEDKAAICDEYSNYCYYEEEDEGDDANNNNNGNDFEINYDECMKYENQYGRIFYFAPHCGSDHFTITLGVFADENCGTYMGEEYSIGQILGRDDDFDSMFLFPKECIYCNGQDKLEGYNQDYNEDNDEEEQADEEDGAVEMCQRLYEEAGTCNVNLNAWQNMYKTSSQITQEENSCNFIAEIRSGKYEEGGDITISSPSFDLSNWRDLDEYKKFGIPLVELAALVGSILLVLVLSIILCLTQRELNALDTPWRPKIGHDLINVSRQNSGIGLARSRSAPGNTPLI